VTLQGFQQEDQRFISPFTTQQIFAEIKALIEDKKESEEDSARENVIMIMIIMMMSL
jgi:hypothetical protein